MIEIKVGNIFTSNYQTLVNTINTKGVMGRGIAYEFRLRYPEMFRKYVELCEKQLIKIGKLWLYEVNQNKYILNFPTKDHWKDPSKIDYLKQGLQKFVDTYKTKSITSIAFPILGSDQGGISEKISLEILNSYLIQCEIPIEIWHYDPLAKDELFDKFKNLIYSMNEKELSYQAKLRMDFIRKLKLALEREDINNISGLLRGKGIGEVTLEKVFSFVMNQRLINDSDMILFK
jgi:O-acetyl-ADP-ribose deacetylase (regulator of RNase III)